MHEVQPHRIWTSVICTDVITWPITTKLNMSRLLLAISLISIAFLASVVHLILNYILLKTFGPWPWPILGNLLQLCQGDKSPHEAWASLVQWYKPLMYLCLGSMCIIVVSSLAMAKDLSRCTIKSSNVTPKTSKRPRFGGNQRYCDVNWSLVVALLQDLLDYTLWTWWNICNHLNPWEPKRLIASLMISTWNARKIKRWISWLSSLATNIVTCVI